VFKVTATEVPVSRTTKSLRVKSQEFAVQNSVEKVSGDTGSGGQAE
jgi:hypothetical protein